MSPHTVIICVVSDTYTFFILFYNISKMSPPLLQVLSIIVKLYFFLSLFLQVFGYLNMFVWAGNAWFVYKETRWHSKKFSSQSGHGRQQVPAPI